jgi:hypothetical protein
MKTFNADKGVWEGRDVVPENGIFWHRRRKGVDRITDMA